MRTLPRFLTGVATAAGLAGAAYAGAHYNYDAEANVHEAQACAVEVGVHNVATTAVRDVCGDLNIFASESTITDHKVTVLDTQAFLARELPTAMDRDQAVSTRRNRELYMVDGIALFAGLAVIRTIRPTERAVKKVRLPNLDSLVDLH